eukprot:jgi/Botrbrau1/2293/Bobra.101_2s0115.3
MSDLCQKTASHMPLSPGTPGFGLFHLLVSQSLGVLTMRQSNANFCAFLQPHFPKKLKEAAAALSVCPTTLKRNCRRLGINKWPQRAVTKAIDRAILQRQLSGSSRRSSPTVHGGPGGSSGKGGGLERAGSQTTATLSVNDPRAGNLPQFNAQPLDLDLVQERMSAVGAGPPAVGEGVGEARLSSPIRQQHGTSSQFPDLRNALLMQGPSNPQFQNMPWKLSTPQQHAVGPASGPQSREVPGEGGHEVVPFMVGMNGAMPVLLHIPSGAQQSLHSSEGMQHMPVIFLQPPPIIVQSAPHVHHEHMGPPPVQPKPQQHAQGRSSVSPVNPPPTSYPGGALEIPQVLPKQGMSGPDAVALLPQPFNPLQVPQAHRPAQQSPQQMDKSPLKPSRAQGAVSYPEGSPQSLALGSMSPQMGSWGQPAQEMPSPQDAPKPQRQYSWICKCEYPDPLIGLQIPREPPLAEGLRQFLQRDSLQRSRSNPVAFLRSLDGGPQCLSPRPVPQEASTGPSLEGWGLLDSISGILKGSDVGGPHPALPQFPGQPSGHSSFGIVAQGGGSSEMAYPGMLCRSPSATHHDKSAAAPVDARGLGALPKSASADFLDAMLQDQGLLDLA